MNNAAPPRVQSDALRTSRSKLFRTFIAFGCALGLAGAIGAVRLAADQLIAGSNVNVVGGPTCLKAGPDGVLGTPDDNPNCPFQVYGDVTVQRQNEGSAACSARNPLNCLAAANDYRLVGVAGPQDGKITGDAWLGYYWTHDGGGTWRSTLLAGYPGGPTNTEPNGGASPIQGFEAAADPTVRAGVAGLIGLSGIAFNRANETAAAAVSGGEGKSGVQFFSLFIDDNIASDPDGPGGPLTYADVPPRYIRTVIVDSGTAGRFLDKPWHFWDIPRTGATGSCTTSPPGSPNPVTVSTGYVYIAYATFLGSGNNPHGNIWFKKSLDCGQTWSNATKITESIPINQSPIVVVNPVNGNVHVVWREFGLNGGADRILTARSTNFGKSFTKASEVANLGVPSPTTLSTAFDAFSLPSQTSVPPVTDQRQARSNDYPGFCIGTDGLKRVVFSKRTPDANGWARIAETTSTDGITWSAPTLLDTYNGPGHQFQPSILCTGTRATAMWFDQRNDNAFFLDPDVYPFIFYPFIVDPIPVPPVHTIDVRAAQQVGTGAFEPSIQVSHYPIAYDTSINDFVQLQFHFINWPLFAGGIVPFIGDYPDLFAKNQYKPPIGSAGWTFNDYANETPIVNALWTDNRDVLQLNTIPDPDNPNWATTNIADIDWTNFVAPGSAECTNGTLTWSRNQNIYTSALTRGVVVQAEGNARRTPDLMQRAYVIFINNQTPVDPGADGTYGTSDDLNSKKRFKLSFGTGSGPASFSYSSPVNELFADVPALSGITRSVFIDKNQTAPVIVLVVEVDANGTPVTDGLKGSTTIAPDPNAPVQSLILEDHNASVTPLPVFDQDGNLTNSLTYPNTTSLISPTFISPTFISPTFISNVLNPTFISPTFISPTFISPTFISPTFISPTFISPTFISPTFISPTFISPTFISPTFISPTFISSSPNVTESSVGVTNTGTVTSGYNLDAVASSMPAGALFQILVNKLYTMPGTTDCALRNQVTEQLVSNVTSTNGAASTSFSLAPGEQAIVTFRGACTGDSQTPCFNLTDLGLVVGAQAPNCTTTGCDPAPFVYDTIKPTLSVPNDITTDATSPAGAVVTFNVTATDNPDGPLAAEDILCDPASGATFPVGTTTVTCTATDSHGNSATGSFDVTVAPFVNDPPQANDDSATVTAGGTAAIDVLANDTDPEGATLTITEVTQGAHGSVVINGGGTSVNYTADGTYAGGDTFMYTVSDGDLTTTATVTMTVVFGFNGPLSPYAPPPAFFRQGSGTAAVPIVWQYKDSSGTTVDTPPPSQGGTVVPTVTFTKLDVSNVQNCTNPVETATVFSYTNSPPSTQFVYYSSTNPHPTAGANTWQFNWRTQAPVTAGCYNIRVILNLNGQVNGPFPIRLQ